MTFKEEFEKRRKFIETLIEGELRTVENAAVSDTLIKSMIYSMTGGGKRLRPILFLECRNLFDRSELDTHTKKLAAAIEFIHQYTLIHDDLPCLDNDDMRRGRLSNHKVFGESFALLAGDALLNTAYELMFKAIMKTQDKVVFAEACSVIARLAGASGVIGGQALEFECLNDTSKLSANIEKIYKNKTGGLMAAPIIAGSILGGAKAQELIIMESFAYNLGFIFQLRDDILDISEKGNLEKNSFAALNGIKNTNNILDIKIECAIGDLEKISGDTKFLKEITVFAGSREI